MLGLAFFIALSTAATAAIVGGVAVQRRARDKRFPFIVSRELDFRASEEIPLDNEDVLLAIKEIAERMMRRTSDVAEDVYGTRIVVHKADDGVYMHAFGGKLAGWVDNVGQIHLVNGKSIKSTFVHELKHLVLGRVFFDQDATHKRFDVW